MDEIRALVEQISTLLDQLNSHKSASRRLQRRINLLRIGLAGLRRDLPSRKPSHDLQPPDVRSLQLPPGDR